MKIICIGRNYINHTKELKNPIPKEPIFFIKPDTAILRNNEPFYYPEFSDEINYEVELILKIKKVGKHIAEEFADRYYDQIGLGIDFTARDIQRQLKNKGLPWEKAKGFDNSAPICKQFIQKDDLSINNINFCLKKNNKIVQKGNSADMIFNFNQITSFVSKFVTLKIGDLIFTGTPAGVGEIKINDNFKGYINNNLMFDFFIK